MKFRGQQRQDEGIFFYATYLPCILSVCQSVSLSVCQSISLSVYQCVSVSVCQCVTFVTLLYYTSLHAQPSVCHSPVNFRAHSRTYQRLSAPIRAHSRSLPRVLMHEYLQKNDKNPQP